MQQARSSAWPRLMPGADATARRRRALRRWFRHSRRDFSWRRTRDPWETLVAETLLRRTRAAQVERRIGEVLERYPTPRAMACTPVEQVRKDLRSFGLQWRADNLAASSQVIVQQLEGRVPTDLEGLMALPGVGPVRGCFDLCGGQRVRGNSHRHKHRTSGSAGGGCVSTGRHPTAAGSRGCRRVAPGRKCAGKRLVGCARPSCDGLSSGRGALRPLPHKVGLRHRFVRREC
jgi:hypothetical protein